MKMRSSRFYGNWYLFALGMVTFIFLSQMAAADPLCTNCSVNLVKWALPRSEMLMVGWMVAVVNESWMARFSIRGLFRKLPYLGRKLREQTQSQTAENSSKSNGRRSASD